MSNEEHGTVTTSDEPSTATCPVMNAAHQAVGITANQHWWPESVNLRSLRQNHPQSDPMGDDFDYAAEFNSLDFEALAHDVDALMTDSKEWWPADFGHYGPFFIRMSWHAAGTYRIADGRGGGGTGAQRFAPLNSWPDNASLDKARRLLWPVKQKYGRKISWADLLVFAGNRALETMGFKTFGFGGGREDIWAPEDDVYWGPERVWLEDQRYSGDRELANPLGAVQMGLIYVNPEGPNGNPDPMASARDIRETFAPHGDERRGDRGADRRRSHLRQDPRCRRPRQVRRSRARGSIDRTAGFRLDQQLRHRQGRRCDHQWPGGDLDQRSDPMGQRLLLQPVRYEWELTKSPAGANQWTAKNPEAQGTVPDAHDPTKRHAPTMLTSDLALIVDPVYKEISKRFYENPDQFADAFARAWYKLLHRDMGPVVRYLGPWVPDEELLWQDPVPAVDARVDRRRRHRRPQGQAPRFRPLDLTARLGRVGVGVDVPRHRQAGWRQRGAIRLSPQAEWDVNVISGIPRIVATIEGIQQEFNGAQSGGKQVSLADLIVLGGCAAIEQAAQRGGHAVQVPFKPGRADATQEQTDVESFAVLEPTFDGFRNYLQKGHDLGAEHLLIEKAFFLRLSAPEMTALVGGLRVLNANAGQSDQGVFTDRPETLTNDFFVNLLDMATEWKATSESEDVFEGRDRVTGDRRWSGTRVDLIFGSSSELRALAEVYACDDADEKFVRDFVAAWDKVMNLDRFDLD